MACSLHNYLKRFRKEAGLSQEEVATLLGKSQRMISRHEEGQLLPSGNSLIGYEVLYRRPLKRLFRGHYEIVSEEIRTRAEKLVAALPANAGRKVEALSQVAFPNDPVIVPLSWRSDEA